MNILVYSLLLTVFAFLLHLIIWRIRLPKKQTSALFSIFSSILIFGSFFLFKFPGLIEWNIAPSINVFEVVQFFLLFISIAVSYIVSYPAIEVDSPTLIIIKTVSDGGPGGLDKNKLENMMSDDLLIMPRIRDMLSDNMLYSDGKRYKLTSKGFVIARIFLLYRKIIRGAKGG